MKWIIIFLLLIIPLICLAQENPEWTASRKWVYKTSQQDSDTSSWDCTITYMKDWVEGFSDTTYLEIADTVSLIITVSDTTILSTRITGKADTASEPDDHFTFIQTSGAYTTGTNPASWWAQIPQPGYKMPQAGYITRFEYGVTNSDGYDNGADSIRYRLVINGIAIDTVLQVITATTDYYSEDYLLAFNAGDIITMTISTAALGTTSDTLAYPTEQIYVRWSIP